MTSTALSNPPAVRPRSRAATYAEQLGLNKSYEEAKGAISALGVLYHQRSQATGDVRTIKALIENTTTQVAVAVREAHPDAGPTAIERHLKEQLDINEKLIALRADLVEKQNEADNIEAEIKLNEVSARVETARMNMLGEYFGYLSASKEALTAERILNDIP